MLEVRQLKKYYSLKTGLFEKSTVKALDGVSFSLAPGETLALVGESGCGKSTLAKVLLGLEAPTSGDIFWEGKNYLEMDRRERLGKIQMVFQDPYGSLNPRKRAWEIVAEPLIIHGLYTHQERKKRALSILERVGLSPELSERFPHMFSGGQRQRLGLARGLISGPKLLVCDEPVSALDVSVQSQVLNLLLDLQKDLGLSYLFISHDLSVVRHISDNIMVMYLGQLVETGPTASIYTHAHHPYSAGLMSHFSLRGEQPSPLAPPPGCTFHPRCPQRQEKCQSVPPLLEHRGERSFSCHFPL